MTWAHTPSCRIRRARPRSDILQHFLTKIDGFDTGIINQVADVAGIGCSQISPGLPVHPPHALRELAHDGCVETDFGRLETVIGHADFKFDLRVGRLCRLKAPPDLGNLAIDRFAGYVSLRSTLRSMKSATAFGTMPPRTTVGVQEPCESRGWASSTSSR